MDAMSEGMTCCRVAQASAKVAKVAMVRCPDCDRVYEQAGGLWMWIPPGMESALPKWMDRLVPVAVRITGWFARAERWVLGLRG